MTAIDISRQTTNVALPQEVSAEIWAKAIEESAFMRLARQIRIPGPGLTIQTITGEPIADWVDETAAKPVSTHTFGKKVIKPYKLAFIETFSMEFRRDSAALYAECINRAPKALGKKFDATIMGTTAPGDGFDVLGSCHKQSIVPTVSATVYDQFLAADAAISDANGVMNGIALAPQGRSIVLGAVDTTGRPLFTPGVQSGTVGDILGAPVYMTKGVYVAGNAGTSTKSIVGIAGDFENAIWGSVEGIQITISDQASLTLANSSTLNLWQNNMFAVRFEVEVAFAVEDKDEFVLLEGTVPSSGSTGITGA